VWLGCLVLVSAAIRLAFAKRHPGPWIFGDELIYSNLAASVAKTGSFAIQDSPGLHGYGPAYPLLIAPAYAVYDDLAHAFAAAKAINSVLMSLVAVPVYLIARRFLSSRLSLLAAALALAVPSLLYTGTIMTENAFYPAFAVCFLLMLLVLERPTALRQAAALATIGLAFLIRAQAVALVAAFVTAIVLMCLGDARLENRLTTRGVIRRLDAFRVTWIAFGAGLVVVFVGALVRGKSPSTVLGAYGGLAEKSYSFPDVTRWFVLHVAELDLYLGILPMAALLVLAWEAFTSKEMARSLRLFAILATSAAFWMTLVVAATVSYLSSGGVGRIEERNLFHVAPLFLIALVAWLARGLPRPWPAAALAAVAAGALPGAISYNSFANLSALSDTLVLIPLWNIVFFGHVQAESLPVLVLLCSTAAAALFLVWPRRAVLVPAVLVLAWFVLLQVTLERQIAATSRGVLSQGLGARREWIDEAVGGNADVAMLWTGQPGPMTVLQNAFFNRSVHPFYGLDGAVPPTGILSQRAATIDPATGAVQSDGSPVRAEYALADPTLELEGSAVARDPLTGLVIYRLPGERVHARIRTAGVYPDSWTGPEAKYTVWRCKGGRFTATVASQPGLFKASQTVVARSGNRLLARLRLRPGEEKVLRVPMSSRDGRCILSLRVSPTAVPQQVLGTPDSRALGVLLSDAQYAAPDRG
jgi:hypothetical protein